MALGGVSFTKLTVPVENQVVGAISVSVGDLGASESFDALPFTTTAAAAAGESAVVSCEEPFRVVAYDASAAPPASGVGVPFSAGIAPVLVRPGQKIRVEAL